MEHDAGPNARKRYLTPTNVEPIRVSDLLAEPDEAVPWLVDGLLPAGGLSIVVAKPKVGKSTMSRCLAVAVARRISALGRSTVGGCTLYVSMEEKRHDVKAHLRRLVADEHDVDMDVHIGPAPERAMEWLEDSIVSRSYRLVVLDPIARFLRMKDLKDYSEVTRASGPLIALAHKHGCHILMTHHAKKGEQLDDIDSVLGSTGLAGMVDTVMVIKRRNGTRYVSTIQRSGEDLAESALNYEHDTGLVQLGTPRMATVSNEYQTRVMDVLRTDGPLIEEEVLRRVQGDRVRAGEALRQAYLAGLISRAGSGRKGNPYLYSMESHEGAKGERENQLH